MTKLKPVSRKKPHDCNSAGESNPDFNNERTSKNRTRNRNHTSLLILEGMLLVDCSPAVGLVDVIEEFSHKFAALPVINVMRY